MNTEERIGWVCELADRLDQLTDQLEQEASAAVKKETDLEEQLDTDKRLLEEQKQRECAEQKEKTQAPIDKDAKILGNLDIMTKRLVADFGEKFGKDTRKITARKMNIHVLQGIFQKMTDPSFLAVMKRLVGMDGYEARKKTYGDFLFLSGCYRKYLEEDIQRLEEDGSYQLSLIEEKYHTKMCELEAAERAQADGFWQRCKEKQGELLQEGRRTLIDVELAQYDREIGERLAVFPEAAACWERYRERETALDGIYIGDVLISWLPEEDMGRLFGCGLSEVAPHSARGENLAAPYTESVTSGMKLLVEYDEEPGWLAGSIQSMLLQVIHGMPLYRYQITFMDAVQNARDLGDMTVLSAIEDTEIEDIHPGVGWEKYHMLNICQDKEEIRSRMQELSDFIKKVSVLLGRTDSVEVFNRNSKLFIPYHFIVIENFPTGWEEDAINRLEGIVRQAKRFGFSFLILGKEGISAEFPELTEGFTGIRARGGSAMIQRGKWHLPVEMKTFPEEQMKYPYLDSLRRQFVASFGSMDNRFEHFIPYEKGLPVCDATAQMEIPFAVNRRGKLMKLVLGSSLTAHGLLSGGTGSGKTTLLHALINSVMLHYTPEDVQLWLVDYKLAEFAVYAQNTPRNIKLVGVQDGKEFTFAFLDYVTAEYQRRMKRFQQATEELGVSVTSMQDYRRRYGKDSMPRILIIVDEFHKMTQHIQDNEYKEVLENHLSEIRACGMSYLFSDQTVSVGLRGLTEKGRRQIMVRLAMLQAGGKDAEQEIVETIGIDRERAKKLNESLGTGHVLFQQQVPMVGADGMETERTVLLHCKSLWLDGEHKREINQALLAQYGEQTELVYADGSGAKERDEEVIRSYLAKKAVSEQDDGIPLVLGTPANLDPCMVIRLVRNYNQNVLCVGENQSLRLRILLHALYSLADRRADQIYVIAEQNDSLLQGDGWRQLRRLESQGIQLVTEKADICELIHRMAQKVRLRQSGKDAEDGTVFLFWIGLDNLFHFFQTKENAPYRPKSEEKSADRTGIFDLSSAFDSLFPGMREEASFDRRKEEQSVGSEEDDGCYDASEDVGRLLMNGPQNGVFHYVTYSAVTPLHTYRRIVSVERFVHRIALKMDENASGDLLNNKSKMASRDLKAGQAVYYDGGGAGRYFIPYR